MIGNRNKLIALLLSIVLVFTVVIAGCSSKETKTSTSKEPAKDNEDATDAQKGNTTGNSEADQVAEEDKDFVLRIGYGGSLCEAPLHMAVEKGFFEEEGLQTELIKLAPGTIFDSVTANQIDAGFSLLASLIQPLSNGLPIKITTGLHTGCDKVLVKKDSGIETPEDFIGKKVGVPSMTSSPIIFAKRVLSDHGVGIDVENSEVEFVVYSATDLPIALENGAVDAIAMNDPTASIAARDYNFTVIFDSATDEPYKDQYCCSAFVRENIAADYPNIATKYTRAMQKASAWVQENQEEVVQIQIDNKWVAGDMELNARVLKTFNYIPSVQGAYDAFGIVAPQLQVVGMLDSDVDVKALQERSFVFLEGIPDEFK